MSWNYRVVKMICANGGHDYAVNIVHYDESGAPAMVSVHDVSPAGEDAAEFTRSLALWNRALEKPVLIFDNRTDKFVGEEPPINTPPACPDCGRPMTRRSEWYCPKHEEWDE